jgi:hypothetical protein
MSTEPTPSRLVPEHLLSAARLTAREDNYGNNERAFKQGRGPLCYGNAEYQTGELLRRARLHDKLASAYYALAQWMDAHHSMDES